MGTSTEFVVIGTEYQFPAEIHSDELGIQSDADLNVHLYGVKRSPKRAVIPGAGNPTNSS